MTTTSSVRPLLVHVPGIPRPQGSKRHVGHGRLVEMSKHLPEWRKDVAAAAAGEWAGQTPIEGPVAVSLVFSFARPAAAKDRPWPHKMGPGDVDKLARAVLDALTKSGVYRDDAQVVQLTCTKMYSTETTPPGVHIRLYELP